MGQKDGEKWTAAVDSQEITPKCGVMLLEGAHLIVARSAPRKPMETMPFHVWMALVKATPVARDENSDQAFFTLAIYCIAMYIDITRATA